MKTKFGGERSSGFALIYDSPDLKQKIEPAFRVRRETKSKLTKITRKQKKEIKIRKKKVHGIAKNKVKLGDKKKK